MLGWSNQSLIRTGPTVCITTTVLLLCEATSLMSSSPSASRRKRVSVAVFTRTSLDEDERGIGKTGILLDEHLVLFVTTSLRLLRTAPLFSLATSEIPARGSMR